MAAQTLWAVVLAVCGATRHEAAENEDLNNGRYIYIPIYTGTPKLHSKARERPSKRDNLGGFHKEEAPKQIGIYYDIL